MKKLNNFEDKIRKPSIDIMEIDGETYNQINKNAVLYIGWRKCKYFDHNIIQCFKCWKFDHIRHKNVKPKM